MNRALEIVRNALRYYPDHGATDPAVTYKLTGAEMAIIHDALAKQTSSPPTDGPKGQDGLDRDEHPSPVSTQGDGDSREGGRS